MNIVYREKITFMIYGCLCVLALGLLVSPSLLALSHIIILIPGIYFLSKIEVKNISISMWSLAAFSIALILSILFNQDISILGYLPILKIKYFLFGLLMIFPFSWYFFISPPDSKKITFLIYAFCISTTVATILGLIAMKIGHIPLIGKKVHILGRNGGVFGMLMNYAHNMAYFLIINLGLLINHKKLKVFVKTKFIFIVFIINLIGFYFCYTRGAWLGFISAVPFFFIKNHRKSFFVMAIGLALFGSIFYIIAGKNVIRSGSDNQRISQWKAATKAFNERPVFGYGYLNFEHHSTDIKKRYNIPEVDFAGHAHNNFFEVLADAGLVGLITYLAWLIYWIVELLRRDDIIADIGFPFIIVFIVSGLTQSTIALGVNLFFIMAVYAITQSNRCLLKLPVYNGDEVC